MKRALVAPLDWGLGHATRCIPIIERLSARKLEVLLAGSGDSLMLLRQEFPSLKYFYLPGYNPVYPTTGSMLWKMVLQLPKFFNTIKTEHRAIEKIVLQEKIDLIIADNRYGCWSAQVPCVFITHQCNILMPRGFFWLRGLVQRMNEGYMKKFTRCWVPDFPHPPHLAGDLVSLKKRTKSLSVDYIGMLSRFRGSVSVKKQYDIAVILSGPEPQRTLLENKVLYQFKASSLKYYIVRGLVSPGRLHRGERSVDFLTSRQLQEVIESSDIILARSGYSTVMDMAALRKKVIFIPTPGQTEQEYLAQRLMDQGIAFFMRQGDFDLQVALEHAKRFSGFSVLSSDFLLDKALNSILNYNHV